jgi:hypothetical protein
MSPYTIGLFMFDSDVFVKGVTACLRAACLVGFAVERKEIFLGATAIDNNHACVGATAKPTTQPALV